MGRINGYWRGNRQPVRTGFTLIELLVVVAIISILAAILFPAFARVRENARKSACQNNLKQIATAFHQYLQDYDHRYPPGQDTILSPEQIKTATRAHPGWKTCCAQSSPSDVNEAVLWPAKLEPYLKNRQVYTCPSAKTKINICEPASYNVTTTWKSSDPVWPNALNVTYGYNVYYLGGGIHVNSTGTPGTYWRGCQNSNAPSTTTCYNCGQPALDSDIASTASTLLLVDNSFQMRTTGLAPAFAHLDLSVEPGDDDVQCSSDGSWDTYDSFDPRHNQGLNVAFADGHVKWMKKPDVVYMPPGYTCSAGYNSVDPKFIWNRF